MYPMIENFVLSENERTQKFMLTGTWKKSYVINYVKREQGLYFYVP